MGFREDIIQEYEAKTAKQAQEQAADQARRVEQRLEDLRQKICKYFGLDQSPEIETVDTEAYYPEFYFKIDDVQFTAHSGFHGITIHVVSTCKICGGQILSHAVDSRLDVGLALTDEGWHQAHTCPKEEEPPYDAGSLAASYRLDSPEYRLIEAVKDMIYEHAPSRD
jgi:hypothetical protein